MEPQRGAPIVKRQCDVAQTELLDESFEVPVVVEQTMEILGLSDLPMPTRSSAIARCV